MGKFLARNRLPMLPQEEIDNLSSPIDIKGIGFVMKNLPTKKISGLDDFIGIFMGEIAPVLHKVFQKTKESVTRLNSL